MNRNSLLLMIGMLMLLLPRITGAQHLEKGGQSILAFQEGYLEKDLYKDPFVRVLAPPEGKPVPEKLTQFYQSWIYPTRTLKACSKGDTLGSAYGAVMTNPSFPSDFVQSEKVLRDTANVISSFTLNGKTIYVHAITVQGELCNCMYSDFEGKIWPIAMPVNIILAGPVDVAERKRLAGLDLKTMYENYMSRFRK